MNVLQMFDTELRTIVRKITILMNRLDRLTSDKFVSNFQESYDIEPILQLKNYKFELATKYADFVSISESCDTELNDIIVGVFSDAMIVILDLINTIDHNVNQFTETIMILCGGQNDNKKENQYNYDFDDFNDSHVSNDAKAMTTAEWMKVQLNVLQKDFQNLSIQDTK